MINFYILLNELKAISLRFNFVNKQLRNVKRFNFLKELLREEALLPIKKKGQKYSKKPILRRNILSPQSSSFKKNKEDVAINLPRKAYNFFFLGISMGSTLLSDNFFKSNFLYKKNLSYFVALHLLCISFVFINCYSILRISLALYFSKTDFVLLSNIYKNKASI